MRTALEYGLAVGVVALVIGSFSVVVAALCRLILLITGMRELPPVRDFFSVAVDDLFGAMFLFNAYLLGPALRLAVLGALLTGLFGPLVALT